MHEWFEDRVGGGLLFAQETVPEMRQRPLSCPDLLVAMRPLKLPNPPSVGEHFFPVCHKWKWPHKYSR